MYVFPESLTIEDLDSLPDPEELSMAELTVMRDRLNHLYDDVEAEEPEEESEAYEEWVEDLEEIDDLLDEVEERIEELKNQQE